MSSEPGLGFFLSWCCGRSNRVHDLRALRRDVTRYRSEAYADFGGGASHNLTCGLEAVEFDDELKSIRWADGPREAQPRAGIGDIADHARQRAMTIVVGDDRAFENAPSRELALILSRAAHSGVPMVA
jgi:hypothetical protein